MTKRFSRRQSFKWRILFAAGSVVIFAMMIISLSTIYQWKNVIIEKELKNAENLGAAFSISAIDALIFAEYSHDVSGLNISRRILEFYEKTPDVKFISLINSNARVIAHSDLSKSDTICKDSLTVLAGRSRKPVEIIRQHPEFGWIIESIHPLRIGGKFWGSLNIAIDANDLRTQIRFQFFRWLFITILLSSVTLLLIYYLVSKLTKSLKELVDSVDKIDFTHHQFSQQPQRNDEIGFLARRFHALETRLSASRAELIGAQQQIFQAEKLASIGRLASGVAHEINNPLNGIKSCIYSINKQPEKVKKNKMYLDLVNEGLNHIEVIVQKLLGFARQQSPKLEKVNVNEAIMKVVQLLDYRFTQKNIQLNLALDETIETIHADAQNLQEVVMNILINAMDAVENHGTISVSTRMTHSKQVCIRIKDDGEGIGEQELKIIFDPFYTSKDPGLGTGLGLSVSQSIIDAHGGKIEVDSSLGQGSSFQITLPIGDAGKDNIR